MSLSVAAKMSVSGPPGMQAFNVEPPAAAAAAAGPRSFFTTERLMAFMALLAIGLGVVVNQVGPKPEGGHPASEPRWRVFESYGLDVFHRLVKLVGTTWISMLQLAVLPYIGTNMVVAMADFKEAGEGSNRLVVKTVAYYLTTTFFACLIGLAYSILILIPNMPEGLTYSDAELEPTNTKDIVGQIEGIIQGLIPKNIVAAGASTNLLGVIFFFTVVGYTIEHTAARPSYLFMALKELNESMNKFILTSVAFAPIAVFCLLYVAIATIKDIEGLMESTAVLCGICFLGSGTLILVVYPILFFVFNRTLPVAYYLNSAPAMVTALSTSSSAATLPVTIHCTIKNNGVKAELAKFVCSLGATVNMDGSAVTYPMFILFIAAAQDIKVTGTMAVTLALVSTLASIGAAPIPNAGSVLLIMALDTLQIPVNDLLSIVILLDAVIVDRLQTMNNVLGDTLAAKCIESWVGVEAAEQATVALASSGTAIRRRTSVMSPADAAAISAAVEGGAGAAAGSPLGRKTTVSNPLSEMSGP